MKFNSVNFKKFFCSLILILFFSGNFAYCQSRSATIIENRITDHLLKMFNGKIETKTHQKKQGYHRLFIIIKLPNKQKFGTVFDTIQKWYKGYGDMGILKPWEKRQKSDYSTTLKIKNKKAEGAIDLRFCGKVDGKNDPFCPEDYRIRITVFSK